MNLEELGWNSYFDEHYRQFSGGNDFIPARVARENRQRYDVISEKGTLSAIVSGSFAFNTDSPADYPAVGDWVVVNAIWDESKAIIHKVLPRTTGFTRKSAGTTTDEQTIAANVDIVFLVVGLNTEFNLRRIERYLTQISLSGAELVILLNKADLCADPLKHLTEVESICNDIPIHYMSAITDPNIDCIRQYLSTGKTATMVGSSGTGKTTIINRLLGSDQLKTGDLTDAGSGSDGKHTTTWRELVLLPTGGVIIDSPGMRELQLWADTEDVSSSFEDIQQLMTQCSFRNCQHESEPGCAIRKAIKEGVLDPGRFNNYQKMNLETKYLEQRKLIRAFQDKRVRQIEISKYSRKLKKANFKGKFK